MAKLFATAVAEVLGGEIGTRCPGRSAPSDLLWGKCCDGSADKGIGFSFVMVRLLASGRGAIPRRYHDKPASRQAHISSVSPTAATGQSNASLAEEVEWNSQGVRAVTRRSELASKMTVMGP